MTRCPASDSTVRALFKSLAAQPLARLNLSYNTLGHVGASALVSAMPSWAPSMQRLVLEMNGFGDVGCKEVAGVLAAGALPELRVLELGWNELSGSCAPLLARLLAPRGLGGDTSGRSGAPKLQKLGLGGNSLGNEGGQVLALAALRRPDRTLEVDLSMNHIGAAPLQAIADWAASDASRRDPEVSINLEWNIIDDGKVVQRLARALASRSPPAASAAQRRAPLLRLANNELTDVDPAVILAESRGMVMC